MSRQTAGEQLESMLVESLDDIETWGEVLNVRGLRRVLAMKQVPLDDPKVKAKLVNRATELHALYVLPPEWAQEALEAAVRDLRATKAILEDLGE